MPGYRCVLGCDQTGSVVHVFPNPGKCPQRFKLWVNAIGGRLETASDYEYYKKKRICDIHFKEEHKNRFKRLNALAVPCLYLPGGSTLQLSNPSLDIETGNIISSSTTPVNTADLNYNCSSVWTEHNYSVVSKGKQKQQAKKAVLMGCQESGHQTRIKKMQSEICRLRKKCTTFKQRLSNAQKLSSNEDFQQLIKQMKKPAQLFINMQKQAKYKAKGRRFSIEEKILCLSLYKKSPKCYKLMSQYFTLPSSRAMIRLLSQIKIKEGINTVIFNKIKQALQDQDAPDRLCTLIFDEMSITPQIFYNAAEDKFTGFAFNKDSSFADHALVFMVKGVKSNFKQPVAYYFTNSLNKIELKNLIKSVVKEVTKAGLIVVATICDQSAVNVGAVSELINDTKAEYLRKGKEWSEDIICLFGKKIIPLFDPPHLIKGVRNNLLDKDLVYTTNNSKNVVKWEYFEEVYEADKTDGELKTLTKITEEHIYREKINKMRVKSATQLFSHSFAVATNNLAEKGKIREECRQIIDIVLLLDKIFDSVNGSTFDIPNGKVYKGPVKRNSPHHDLWLKAIKTLESVKFVKCKKLPNKTLLTESIAPSVKNLIKTIKGMQSLWQILNKKYNIDTVLTRNFNQDPVENFFGSIRSYGFRNIAPNTVCFEGAYKALMVNNMNSPHSKGANCEEDFNQCLQNLDFYLKEKVQAPDASEDFTINFEKEICSDHSNENDVGQSNYVCGWVIKKCLINIVKKCENCRLTLVDNKEYESNAYIRCKEYVNKRWLCYPSQEVHDYFKSIQNITVSILKKDLPKSNVKKSIILYEDILIDCPFKCLRHKNELKIYFLNTTLNVLLYSWTRSVNRILSGKITYHGEDEIKMAAQAYYNKFKHYKNRK